MSKAIGVVQGLRLPNMGPGRLPDLQVGTFSGGERRGPCVQLTSDGATFIQFDAAGVRALMRLLQRALDEDES